jgi:hypothetical protein
MQAELQDQHVIPGHRHGKSTPGPLPLTSKISNEEKGADWFKPRMSGFCVDQAGDEAIPPITWQHHSASPDR